jgi:hypothetical protein
VLYVETVPLTPGNLEICAPLWGGAGDYAPGELQRVFEGATRLLGEKRGQGAVILENGQPRSFAMSVFADEAVVDAYLEDPHPHLGKRLLLESRDPHSASVLHIHQIAERNAGQGLQLVVANCNIHPETRDRGTVMGATIAATLDAHRGYRIARYVNEVFGEPSVSMIQSSGAFDIRRVFELSVAGGTMQSLVGVITREQAAARMNPMLALFTYSPPQLHFTQGQQRVLSEALACETDETVAERLGIPLTAVKARWTRIQERAARCAPELFAQVEDRGQGRGAQTRHLIVRYVREHPSELTPYVWPGRQWRDDRVALRR